MINFMVFENNFKLGLLLIMIVMIFLSGCSSVKFKEDDKFKASSFKECVEKGGNIAESHPRRCFLGRYSFVEVIDDVSIDDMSIQIAKEESFRGEIVKIEDDRDGLIISLKDDNGEIILATISVLNLSSNFGFNFSVIETGNIIEVTGDIFGTLEEKRLMAKRGFVVYDKNAELNCIINKGEYEARGMMQVYMCNIPTKDAGKSCNNMEDCEGICMSDDGKGVCSNWTVNFGCIPVIENGKEVTICID